MPLRHRWKAFAALALASALLSLSGCATPTAVSSSSAFQANEGLAVLRMVDLNSVPIGSFIVRAEASGEEYPLRAVRFGQTSTTTYVGRLPAGRYQPTRLVGSGPGAGGLRTVTVPLNELTGMFDVEAGRVTQLGTMVFMRTGGVPSDTVASGNTVSSKFRFVLPLDPTPVPVDALLAARFPQLALTGAGGPALGWVSGSVPRQPAGLLERARAFVRTPNAPTFAGNALLTGGPLGLIVKRSPGQAAVHRGAPTVNAITALLVLGDGRWLAGGEEGYLALSINEGQRWEGVPALQPDEVVLHLMQKADGRLLMVTDRDHEAVVYESSDNPIAWKVIKRIPSDREQGVLTQPIGEAAHFVPSLAAHSKDRLLVYTRPSTLNSLDLRSGQWESFSTPRRLAAAGLKVSPDGYVVGMSAPYWIYGSHDYGKTWTRLEAWLRMSEPHFFDRRRGVMIASDTDLMGAPSESKLRTTDNGGATWKTSGAVKDWHGGPPMVAMDPFVRTLAPLWPDPNGRVLYSAGPSGRLYTSQDGGRTWAAAD